MRDKELWNSFCEKTNNKTPEYTAWSFGEEADELAWLVACGRKTATSSAYDLYREWQEDLPQPGAYSVILDSAGRARCLIQTTKVYVTPFCQVRASHARMEGEGDGSLSYWRQVHRKFFAECLRRRG